MGKFLMSLSILFLFQYVTEKMGGAEGTKLDLDFVEMERVSKLIWFYMAFNRLTRNGVLID